MLNSYDYMDKRIIAAIREHSDLSRRRWRIIKLDTPVQRGWRRFYVLSEKARLRSDCSVLEAILVVIGTELKHHSPDFRKRRRRRSRKIVEIEQPLRPIPFFEWDREKYPEAWRDYFCIEVYTNCYAQLQRRWVFVETSLFELKIEPNWLWYFRELDIEVEARLGELESWLHFHDAWRHYNRLKGRPARYCWCDKMDEREKSLQHEQQREIIHALANFPEVDPIASAWCNRISFRHKYFSPCSPTRRGIRLRSGPARVQILPWGLSSIAPVAQSSRGNRLKPGTVLVRLQPGAMARVVQSRDIRLKPGPVQVRVLPRANGMEREPDERAGIPC